MFGGSILEPELQNSEWLLGALFCKTLLVFIIDLAVGRGVCSLNKHTEQVSRVPFLLWWEEKRVDYKGRG